MSDRSKRSHPYRRDDRHSTERKRSPSVDKDSVSSNKPEVKVDKPKETRVQRLVNQLVTQVDFGCDNLLDRLYDAEYLEIDAVDLKHRLLGIVERVTQKIEQHASQLAKDHYQHETYAYRERLGKVMGNKYKTAVKECSVCYESALSQPLGANFGMENMACGHNVCIKCSKGCGYSSRTITTDELRVRCPICREVTSFPLGPDDEDD